MLKCEKKKKEAQIVCMFKFWEAEIAILQRKTKDWRSNQEGIEEVVNSPMKDGLSGKFHFLDDLVVIFVLFLDAHDVACCMLSIKPLFYLS